MYVEDKSGGLDGAGRIGWVEMSRTRRSYVYAGRRLLKTGSGYKYNCVDEETPATSGGCPDRGATAPTSCMAVWWPSTRMHASRTGPRFGGGRTSSTKSRIAPLRGADK